MHDVRECVGHLHERAEVRRILGDDGGRDLVRVSLPGRAAGEELVEDHTERPDVRARVDVGLRSDLLGRHVEDGAHHRACPGEARRFADDLRDAEVENLEHPGLVVVAVPFASDEQVRRLEISMHDAHAVGFDHARACLEDVVHGFAQGEALTGLELRVEVATFEELHHDVRDTLRGRVDVRHPRDVARTQARHRSRLALEPCDELGVARELWREHLDRNALLETLVSRLVDERHAPFAEEPDDLVLAVEDLAHVRQALLVQWPPGGSRGIHGP